MLNKRYINEIKEKLNGKVIDLNLYKFSQYNVFSKECDINISETVIKINRKPIIELIQVLQELGYKWTNGLRLHINNFSDLTEQGKYNTELLNTHRFIKFENDEHIELIYSGMFNQIRNPNRLSIEDVLELYYEYKTKSINILPDIRDIKIGDEFIIRCKNVNYTFEIKSFNYERVEDLFPSLIIVDVKKEFNKTTTEIFQTMFTKEEFKKLLRNETEGQIIRITHQFQNKVIPIYYVKE